MSTSAKRAEVFKTWRAKTFDLVIKSAAVTVDADHTLQIQREDAARSVLRLADRQLSPHLSWEDCAEEIGRIFDAAVALDKEMHIRITPIQWLTREVGSNTAVDPRIMVLESGESLCEDQRLLLMVSPGLVKRGQESNKEEVLLPMEIFCQDEETTRELQISWPRQAVRLQPRRLFTRIDRPRHFISKLPEQIRGFFR